MFVSTICFWLLVGSVAASGCSTNAPFSSDIIGRSIYQFRPCYPTRWTSSTTLSVNATHMVYVPYHSNYNYGQFCVEYYVFKLNRWAPMVTHYPFLSMPELNGREMCGVEQDRQKVLAWPQGAAHAQYVDALNKTIAGMVQLRDTGCRRGPPPSFGVNETQYQNPWLEAPISYLRSVAYNYGICLD